MGSKIAAFFSFFGYEVMLWDAISVEAVKANVRNSLIEIQLKKKIDDDSLKKIFERLS